MGGIHYTVARDGQEIGRWFGKSVRTGGTVSHEKQIYLGKVIDKDQLIFFKRKEGYFRFDPTSQTFLSIPDDEVPLTAPMLDGRLRPSNVIVTFGGSYFLHELITGIQYNDVLKRIVLKNPDTMYALLQFYLLCGRPDCCALQWYQNSYARFLYPHANLAGQRISDFYVSFGSDNNRREFFSGHIPYLINATDDEYAILIDSTGCQNACKVPVTKLSTHNNEKNIEFRMILVIQRSTGLPVYYELIPGNVVDSTTINRIMRLMAMYGFKVTAVFGDAAYSCPANMEKVIFYGSDLVMRLNPAYDMYKGALNDNIEKLSTTTYDVENDIRYRNRIVRIIDVPIVVGKDEQGEEVEGHVYLCRDMQAYHSKCDHYMECHGSDSLTAEEMFTALSKFGVFAIVMTQKMEKKDVIPFYYQRQAIEQFFDFAKNYAKMMPVRNHNLNTIQGHMLMSFIATFLVVCIKNKMNLLDAEYISIPARLMGDDLKGEDTVMIPSDHNEGKAECIVEQEPLFEVFKSNPRSMFFSLNFVSADVFEKRPDGNNQLIPSVPWKEANDYFKAFGIPCPEAVLIKEGYKLVPVLKTKSKKNCRKAKVFAVRPYATAEQIEEQKKKKARSPKEKTEAEAKHELPVTQKTVNTNSSQAPTEDVKRKPGRPPGSKNKATIRREAEMKAQGIEVVKRGRGRPVGAKDKKPRKKREKKTD